MNKEKQKCPYCSRKIDYKTRLLEHGNAEHDCPNCNKTSKISQNSNIWILLILCSMFALFIMIFYFSAANSIQNVYDDEGKLGFLVTLFFGKAKEIKWMIWELIPFAIFFFVSPAFIEFFPLKRFMEQTPSKIDLSVPTRTAAAKGDKPTGRTRNIPKTHTGSFSGIYEDISSSSGAVDRTRAFRMSDIEENSDEVTDVSAYTTSKSDSYSSDAPLKKVQHHEQVKEYTPKADRVQREEVSQKTPPQSVKKPAQTSNYSGNRKF